MDLNQITVENRFASELAGLGTRVAPQKLLGINMAHVNPNVAGLLGLEDDPLSYHLFIQQVYQESESPIRPFAQKYTGHQFGHYNPDLGDGRGLLLCEVVSGTHRWDLHLKGAGQTPYSRMGDGRAVLRSTIREYLIGEFLHALDIPTSRALCLFSSEDKAERERMEPAAALIRVGETHIRFGHFEYCYHTQNQQALDKLLDYTLKHHYPDIADSEKAVYTFFETVVKDTASMIAAWQAYGFCHGVMNTDNMNIKGITFDFGPFAMMDDYHSEYICNHTDRGGRYRYSQQPAIGLWNLNMLAYALSSKLSMEELRACLSQYQPTLEQHYMSLMNKRMGLTCVADDDHVLAGKFLDLLQQEQKDFNLSFRALASVGSEHEEKKLKHAFGEHSRVLSWVEDYKRRLKRQQGSHHQRASEMNSVNPLYVPRNYLLNQVIRAAEQENWTPFRTLFYLCQNPFVEDQAYSAYAQRPPEHEKGIPLSCSS